MRRVKGEENTINSGYSEEGKRARTTGKERGEGRERVNRGVEHEDKAEKTNGLMGQFPCSVTHAAGC